jgi:hypothetical protein
VKDAELMLDGGDVQVRKLDPDLCESCDERRATHTVRVDFRTAGFTTALGKFCQSCAKELAARIRAGLPEGPK